MSGQPPAVYVLGGPDSAGRTEVARLLAARFEKGAHLDGAAATTVDDSVTQGFTVVLELPGAQRSLGRVRTSIRSRPCHVIVLLPPDLASARAYAAVTPRVGLWFDLTGLPPEFVVDQILARTAAEASPIVVVDYDEAWPSLFEELAGPIRHAVADLGAEVEHVGSTAVPGLAAKPIIDIDVVVRSGDDVSAAIRALRSLGYTYQGDKGIPGREAFLWPAGAVAHHAYVVVTGNEAHTNHIVFRDYLRSHPDTAAEYAALKLGLAEQYGDDRLGYTDAKTEFVRAVLETARQSSSSSPS
jgi:GrpB-like predicted nucleotidyltransferase (UPF0157 family)